ncbi:MAG: carbamoyltransferase C-terminal domain-containing protein [Candidatus Didemnitutus sp.]|nr:carbamoyltransferase C-terminal domain-containing protein [Candidatus Didemnitutus sp.]
MTRPAPRVILGIGGYLGHDANAALLVNGQLIAAAQEERFTRIKHDGDFPRHAIADCLAMAQLDVTAVTDVVFAEKPLQTHLFNLSARPGNAFTRALGRLVPPRWPGLFTQPARALLPMARFHFAWHHLTHVAGAFHTSPFERAAFLCVDGKGEDYCASMGIVDHGELKILWEQTYENGLGMLYTLVTHYLGFLSFGSEYKVMGLAPYGKPVFAEKLARLFSTDGRGGLRLHAPVRFQWDSLMAALPLVATATEVPVRAPGDPLTQAHIDIAASLQQVFEQEIFKMARFLREQTGEDALIFCGGCAQNCVTAGRLRAAAIFPQIFNSPVGGDMGSGLGAALLLEREQTGPQPVQIDARGFYLGSEPGEVPAAALPWLVPHEGSLFDKVADELAAGRIVAWVRGRMELGARALGARSILADPRQPGMQSRLNLAVKFRESFRPFAPLVLAEDCADWFDTAEASDYMQYTANLVPSRRQPQPDAFPSLRAQLDFPRCEIGSVIHVDYSARLQTIRAGVHDDMHRLLTAFKARTGIPILINTSFNVSGQPIVRTATEGWDCFVNTDIDLLVLHNQLFRNPGLKTREEKLSWLKQFAKSA